MTRSSCKNNYDLVHIEKSKVIIKHAKIVEGRKLVEKNDNHHHQHQTMKIIYQQRQTHNNHTHQFSHITLTKRNFIILIMIIRMNHLNIENPTLNYILDHIHIALDQVKNQMKHHPNGANN